MSTNPLGLRPFQLTAVDKLSPVPGRLIGDEPGLGKTFEAGELDRLVRLADARVADGQWLPTLVLAPKAMLYTWAAWFAKYRPDEKVIVVDARTKKHREKFEKALKERTHDIYIVHYEGLKLTLPLMEPISWLHVIADEAHRIGNRKSQTSKAVRALKAEWRTALTGTAADRIVEQLWAILNFMDPDKWSSFWKYRERYVEDVYDTSTGNLRIVAKANPATMPELKRRLADVMIRRQKHEVLDDLPEKDYKTVWVDLSPRQRRAYDEMRDTMVAWIGEHEDEPLQATVAIAQLIRLQQIALATPTFETVTKMRRQYWTNEDGEYIRDRQGRRISAGLDLVPVEEVEIHLDDPSSKLDAAMEIIEDLTANGEKVVVFSQFSRAIDLLVKRLEKAGIYTGKYVGATGETARKRIVQEFADGDLMVFAGTISAGGTGLNLQSASTLIFLDRAWKPGDNLQAEDRIHRMGQFAAHVIIIDIMARDTVDRGRYQRIADSWHEIQKLLGDKRFDWIHSIEEEELLPV